MDGSKNGICDVCQVLDDGATNHSYCVTFQKYEKIKEEKKQEEEALKRKRIMDEILNDHYKSGPPENDEPVKKKSRGVLKKFKCKKCDFFSYVLKEFRDHEQNHHQNNQPAIIEQEEYFEFPKFVGFNCVLRENFNTTHNYFVTEVCQIRQSNHDNLSETCYFFIPAEIIKLHLGLINKSVKIPFTRSTKNLFLAKFPNCDKTLEVCWASNISQAENCVCKKQILILTKSRFKIIQTTPFVKGKGPGALIESFCKFVDEDQVALENLIKNQSESILNSCGPTKIDLQPQVDIDYYKCVWEKCNFNSDKKFSGIRNHLLKHFKEEIELEAKPRSMLTERQKSNCMSRTGCSVPVLSSRGELVHHFGIFHCLVDDLFHEYGMKRVEKIYPTHLRTSQCPYQDMEFTSVDQFIEHLSLGHFFNLILSEVETMVKFNLAFVEEKKCVANVFKCPFCKKKFSNLVDGGNVGDLRELVIHCGSEHGFSLYYLLLDENVESMRSVLAEFNIKKEQNHDEQLDMKPILPILGR